MGSRNVSWQACRNARTVGPCSNPPLPAPLPVAAAAEPDVPTMRRQFLLPTPPLQEAATPRPKVPRPPRQQQQQQQPSEKLPAEKLRSMPPLAAQALASLGPGQQVRVRQILAT
ncbi:unnamed protein product [Prorocentrum cordatum]|uniref:Uncharacterized protein n=1 Tax=Prorocentrum cordatum TaxID=2364126 RepID=A0ABN9PBT1_9DINO|nr:unnamed protein product [Polarella glacialis]